MRFKQHNFSAPLHVADVGRIEQGRPIRVVTQDFKHLITDQGQDFTLFIRAGYCSDGGSIPRPLRAVVQPWGKFAQAFVVHDILYSTSALSRLEADRILRESVRVVTADIVEGENQEMSEKYTRMGWCQAFLIFWAVRLFGGGGYSRGQFHYENRADRAFEKTIKRDEALAEKIIRTPAALQPVVIRG